MNKIKTFIIGQRGLLSHSLSKIINNSILIPSNELSNNKYFSKKNYQYNIIYNLAYPSYKLSHVSSYEEFNNFNLLCLSKFLDQLNINNINKFIYSSSSAVYSSVMNKKSNITDIRNLYAHSKLTSEALIRDYFRKHKKNNFIISRIFNMYGENENFSIISKLINSYKKKDKIVINNKGNSFRDFIYVEDVALIYKRLLVSSVSGYIDIGTGVGIKVKDLINFIGKEKLNLTYRSGSIIESLSSTANTNNISKIYNLNQLTKIDDYLRLKINISKQNKFHFGIKSNNLNLIEKRIPGIIIYGAGYAGKKIFHSMTSEYFNNVYCFVDDNYKKQRKNFCGVPVISFKKLKDLGKEYTIPSIFMAIPSLSVTQKKLLYKKLSKISENIASLPMKENLSLHQQKKISIKDINYNEIFNRKISEININLIKKFKNKAILITGGAGSIGSELARQLIKTKPKKIIILDHDETALFNIKNELSRNNNFFDFMLGSILNLDFLKNTIKNNNIEYIFHTAAYKHVSMLEKNVTQAASNNIIGTLNILKSANQNVKSITIISTDKAVYPLSVLGITKRISEIISNQYIVKNFNKKSKFNINIVRFGNVFASQGSAINIFIDNLINQKPIEITDFKVERYFMSTAEACNLILQGAQLNYKSGILILKMGKALNIRKLFLKLCDVFNIDLKTVTIKEIGLKKGEKLKEQLSISKKYYKTKHADILRVEEKSYDISKINDLIFQLEKFISTDNNNACLKLMKNFLINEIPLKIKN